VAGYGEWSCRDPATYTRFSKSTTRYSSEGEPGRLVQRGSRDEDDPEERAATVPQSSRSLREAGSSERAGQADSYETVDGSGALSSRTANLAGADGKGEVLE